MLTLTCEVTVYPTYTQYLGGTLFYPVQHWKPAWWKLMKWDLRKCSRAESKKQQMVRPPRLFCGLGHCDAKKTIGAEVLFKGYIQNPTVDHFIDHIQVKLSWSTPTILGGLSRPWSPDQGYEYCLLRSNSSSKCDQRRPRSMCGCSFFKVIDRLNHLMNISSSVGHLAGWTSQKWQPLRCPQKPAEKPGISDIWMCDMVEECMMPHNRSSSCDYDYAQLCLTSCMKG